MDATRRRRYSATMRSGEGDALQRRADARRFGGDRSGYPAAHARPADRPPSRPPDSPADRQTAPDSGDSGGQHGIRLSAGFCRNSIG